MTYLIEHHQSEHDKKDNLSEIGHERFMSLLSKFDPCEYIENI